MFIVPARLLVAYAYASPASFAISASFATYAISAIPAASCWAIRWKGNQRHSFLKKKERNISFIFLFPRKGRFRCQQMIHGKTGKTAARDNDVSISVISEALGHHSETTTQIYLRSIKSSEVDDANAKILAALWATKKNKKRVFEKWTKMNQFFWIFT